MSTDDQTGPRGAQRNRPEHVDALASTVISVLRDRQAVSSDGLRQFVLEHLLRAVLVRGVFQADSLLDELRGYRLSLDTLIDQYVPAAARLLGERWLEDRISFADVTISTLRLQSLLGEASAATRVDGPIRRERLHALIVVPQNEQHFLGASVVAGQLRRLGCEIGMSYDEDFGALTSRVLEDAPDLVLITCARRETLETATKTVQTIRKAALRAPVIALGGAVQADEDEIKEQTGVDIVTNVAVEAVAFCTRQIRSQKPS